MYINLSAIVLSLYLPACAYPTTGLLAYPLISYFSKAGGYAFINFDLIQIISYIIIQKGGINGDK